MSQFSLLIWRYDSSAMTPDTRVVVTVLAEWLGVWRGDQHSIKHSSRGTALPETSRSFLTATFFFFFPFLFFLFYFGGSRRQRATRGNKPGEVGKSKKGGDAWVTSCTRILKHHREGTREAPCCSSGEDGWIYDTLDLSFSIGKTKRRKSHFAIVGPPGGFANLASGEASGERERFPTFGSKALRRTAMGEFSMMWRLSCILTHISYSTELVRLWTECHCHKSRFLVQPPRRQLV